MNRTKFNGPNIMCLSLIVISTGTAITCLKWPFKTALFPLTISLCVLLLALIELLLNLFGEEKAAKKGAQIDFKFAEDVDKKVAFRRTLQAFGSVIGFFVLIILVGFNIAVALYVFLYVKVQGKEKWTISIITACLSWFFFWGLFVWLLDTPLNEGWVQQGLRAIGIIG